MTSSFEKFKILIWKNWTIQKRSWKGGLFEILLPFLIVLAFTYAKKGMNFDQSEGHLNVNSKLIGNPTTCPQNYFMQGVHISPTKAWVTDLISETLKDVRGIQIKTYPNGDALNAILNANVSASDKPLFGVQFDDNVPDSLSQVQVLNYILHLPKSVQFGATISECFYTIQNAIDRVFMKRAGVPSVPEVQLNEFMYSPSGAETFFEIIKTILPSMIILSMFYGFSKIVKNVTLERESRLKEMMKMMGLSKTVHWLSWFVSSILTLMISFTMITAIVCFKDIVGAAIFENSSVVLVWLFFMIYLTGVITFAFLISSLFKKSKTAGTIGTIFYILTAVPYYQLKDDFDRMNGFIKFLICLLVNSGLSQGMTTIYFYEIKKTGLQFNNFFSSDNNGDFSVAMIFFSLISGAVICMLLTLYIEEVFTGDVGVAKPWYFPIAKLLKLFNLNKTKSLIISERLTTSHNDFEDDPTNLDVGIKIEELTKVFGKYTVVNKLSLNMYKSQITVLLGHNGAGKTTTMNMLTGMFSPTSGTAYLDNFDITTQTLEARKSLGMCPQHNVLVDDLTVEEHIIFFCRLKGISDNSDIKSQVKKYLDLLDFQPKAKELSKTLSGGMKRKLSIGIALCGDSKIVMLDEPTAGLDTGARRLLWNLLIEEKKDRTILLTTHHMDEADVLGDRIAIMSEGELQTVGSSFFLKKRFGSGYKLICVKNPSCDVNAILDVLSKYAPDSCIESDNQTEVIFIVSEEHVPKFSQIFKEIEDQCDVLKISSFGCSMTSLEEVFIKIGAGNNKVEYENSSVTITFNDLNVSQKVEGYKAVFYQIYAMFLKHILLVLYRNKYTIGWMTSITVLWLYIILKAPVDSNIYNEAQLPSEIAYSYFQEPRVTTFEMKSLDSRLVDSIESSIGDYTKVMRTDSDFESFIEIRFRTALSNTYSTYLTAYSKSQSNIVGWISQIYDPNLLSAITINTIHRGLFKEAKGNNFDIKTSFQEIPGTDFNREYMSRKEMRETEQSEPAEDKSEAIIRNFIMIYLLLFSLMTYWPSIIISSKVKERVTRSKLLQFISGTNRYNFWLTSYAIDFVIMFVISSAIIGAIALDGRVNFRSSNDIRTYLTIFACYHFAHVPFIYVFSYLFNKHETAESMVSVVGVVLGVFYIVYIIIKLVAEVYWISDPMFWIGLFFAPFNLIDCFRKIGFGYFLDEKNRNNVFHFGEYGIMPNMIVGFCAGFFFITICLIKDHMVIDRIIKRYVGRFKTVPWKDPNTLDDDVREESDKVTQMIEEELRFGNLIMQNLTKFYGNNLAVNQLNLRVGSGECFGLLGVNGAGKTTTFKMMTGDELISNGDVWVKGYSMKHNMIKAQSSIGYCPQFDALLFNLTGRELIKIFALIRGIPLNEIKGITKVLATELGFHMHLDKKSKAYSGGNKRKLSAALSLLGDPNLIFLDEPCTGIDPYSKRQLWTMINKTRNAGKSVVLTSHSMEECEALCTRLAIMVAGEFKCLGSVQHLKNKFAKGFVVTIKLSRDDEETFNNVVSLVKKDFTDAELKEKYMELLTFHITSTSLKWSEIFEKMNVMKSEAPISDFSVTQMSLEQVFLHFANFNADQSNSYGTFAV